MLGDGRQIDAHCVGIAGYRREALQDQRIVAGDDVVRPSASRRQHRPSWLWSGLTSGSKGQIGGEVAVGAGPDTPVSPADRPPGRIWTPRATSHLVLSGLFATQLAGIFAARIPRHGFAIGLALVTAGLLFGLQLCIAWRGAARWPRRRRLGGLLALEPSPTCRWRSCAWRGRVWRGSSPARS